MRHSLHSPSVLLKESNSLRVIVDGYSTNFISTAEPDMRVSSHPRPRGKRPTSENPTRKSGWDQWQWSEVDQNTRLRFKYISGPMDRNDWPTLNTRPQWILSLANWDCHHRETKKYQAKEKKPKPLSSFTNQMKKKGRGKNLPLMNCLQAQHVPFQQKLLKPATKIVTQVCQILIQWKLLLRSHFMTSYTLTEV